MRRFDRRRLVEVLLNLVANAVKFTERGRVEVVVRAGSGDRVTFRVRDEGIGMSREEVARVFGAFAQAAPSSADRYRGSGLGLAIAQRLVQSFGGQVEVVSEPGKGSELSFTLELPAAGEVTELPVRDDPTAEEVIGRLRVLLVEDTVVNQWVVRRMLTAMGFDVDVVGDGRAAVEAWRRSRPDVILMDLHLPILDGAEATRQIRAMERGNRRVPILALTAAAMPAEVEQCLTAGMDAHVAKPVRQEELHTAILRAVRRVRGGS